MVGIMSFETAGADAPDRNLCNYGTSRLRFRGPERRLDRPYVAFLGGTEMFGRFVHNPFPDLIEGDLDLDCVNLGCMNAGVDALAGDPEVLRIARRSQACVLQVLGAQHLSNRFYRVHPRRNDRFLEASAALRSLYPEVDFTEFHFNNHLLGALRAADSHRFAPVREELQRIWVRRMKDLMRAIGRPVVLLLIHYDSGSDRPRFPGSEPALIEPPMLKELAESGLGLIKVDVQVAGQSGDLGDMIFGALQVAAAEHMMGPGAHRRVADAVAPVLRRLAT